MGTALEVFAVVVAVIAVSVAVTVAVTIHRLRRPLLISASVGVPLRWRWSVSRQAVLHRRLLVAVGGVRLALSHSGPGGPWGDLVGEVESLAIDVDRDLVAIEAHPRPVRQKAMAGLEARVREVEQVSARLVQTVGSFEVGRPGRSAAELMERLDAIQGALAELDRPASTGPDSDRRPA